MGTTTSSLPSYQNNTDNNNTDDSKVLKKEIEWDLSIIDRYPIKITPEQSMQLFGLFHTKRTLTGSDVIRKGSGINFRKCVDAKIDISKLFNMQRNLDEWIKYEKVCLDDCKDLALWAPNPFFHFQCNIGDLILKRNILSPQLLIRGGVTFEILWERYGLTPDLMVLIRYTPEEWIGLGIQERHIQEFNETQWRNVFGNLQRKDILHGIHRASAEEET